MSAQSLTSKYRPQRFGDVAGQEAIKRILSRASAEDKIAPAYLFSGTRGVGKTTLARVLAKAVNCVTAPTAEPCNECSQCRQITAGVSPDVIEIDAATHGTVDEARRLKEDIGYAPLQSRYKVFIIDEAHMLSKAAFNALLKTLEEPPGRVTFILATTEPHKILPTIISRCQHYVFKRLVQPELEGHLTGLLDREGLLFEPAAVSLIARRGAGSVRDSMSLLAQVLAMGGETLREQDVRDVLGLAGQDVFYSFMRSFKDLDCLGVSELLRQVLDRGLDIGFFLRELASCWRNMFLLNQSGEKALATLELTEEEGRQWLEWADRFDARHIHACWQMTLDGQRRVMTSLEPALALELLLLNLAYVPKLLSLEALSAGGGSPSGRPAPGGVPRPAHTGQGYAAQPRPAPAPGYGGPSGGTSPAYGVRQGSATPAYGSHQGVASQAPSPVGPQRAQCGSSSEPQAGSSDDAPPPWRGDEEVALDAQTVSVAVSTPPSRAGEDALGALSTSGASGAARQTTSRGKDAGQDARPESSSSRRPLGPPTWKGFRDYARSETAGNPLLKVAMPQLSGSFEGDATGGILKITCKNEFQAGQIKDKNGNLALLQGLAEAYFACPVSLEFTVEAGKKQLSQQELRAKAEQATLFKEARESMGAYIIDVRAKN
jgi:DNA polymerase-3 subunit gamma/tau